MFLLFFCRPSSADYAYAICFPLSIRDDEKASKRRCSNADKSIFSKCVVGVVDGKFQRVTKYTPGFGKPYSVFFLVALCFGLDPTQIPYATALSINYRSAKNPTPKHLYVTRK